VPRWERHERQHAPKAQEDSTWRLSVHLIPYFGELRLDRITFGAVPCPTLALVVGFDAGAVSTTRSVAPNPGAFGLRSAAA
jgi:hypothetical protein